jgi:hypothetical protein
VRPYLEKTLHKKRAGEVAQGIGPEFKPPSTKRKIRRSKCHGRRKYWVMWDVLRDETLRQSLSGALGAEVTFHE